MDVVEWEQAEMAKRGGVVVVCMHNGNVDLTLSFSTSHLLPWICLLSSSIPFIFKVDLLSYTAEVLLCLLTNKGDLVYMNIVSKVIHCYVLFHHFHLSKSDNA
jgi:hypothetical protein